jgi:hypothetical protein
MSQAVQEVISTSVSHCRMSANGPKQTWALALHLSAIEGKADMPFAGCPLLRSLLGVKQTWLFALHTSAYD